MKGLCLPFDVELENLHMAPTATGGPAGLPLPGHPIRLLSDPLGGWACPGYMVSFL